MIIREFHYTKPDGTRVFKVKSDDFRQVKCEETGETLDFFLEDEPAEGTRTYTEIDARVSTWTDVSRYVQPEPESATEGT